MKNMKKKKIKFMSSEGHCMASVKNPRRKERLKAIQVSTYKNVCCRIVNFLLGLW